MRFHAETVNLEFSFETINLNCFALLARTLREMQKVDIILRIQKFQIATFKDEHDKE